MEAIANLYQEYGQIYVDARLQLGYKASFTYPEWMQMTPKHRQQAVQHVAHSLSEFVTRAMVQNVVEKIENSRTMAKAINTIIANELDNTRRAMLQGRRDGILETLGEVLSIIHNSETKQCIRLGKVRTLRKAGSGNVLSQTRAPFSYEFEDALLPAPPVTVDPLWEGAGI